MISEGELERWFVDLIEANVRLPDEVIGDLKAQQNANHHGATLFREIIEEYDRETIYTCIDEVISQSERRVREDLREMPDGKYSFEDVMDNVRVDSGPVNLEVTIEIDDDELIFDYDGTDPATQSAINSYINYTRRTRRSSSRRSPKVSPAERRDHETDDRPCAGGIVPQSPATDGGERSPDHQPATRRTEPRCGRQGSPRQGDRCEQSLRQPQLQREDPETGEQFILYDFMIGASVPPSARTVRRESVRRST